jgi:glycyl-tRNA synthetase beta chain
MWGIGLIPSGDKDPYALRRAALGIIRILLTHKLDLTTLLNLTLNSFTEVNLAPATTSQVAQFIYQRLANYLTSVENYSAKVVSAVLSAPVLELTEIINIAEAFSNWVTHQANTNLFEANKRIENILKKNTHELDLSNGINPQLFNSYESELYTKAHQIDSGLAINDYLVALSTLAQPLTEFFANVMVMDENLVIRSNRLNLLAFLASKFNHYGKLAELA